VVGLVLLALVVVTGAIRRGRFKALRFRQVLFFHTMVSVCFTGIVVGTFFLGLLVVISGGEPVLTTPHGIVGFFVAALSLVQMIPSLAITRRPSIRRIHRIFGYLVVPLFLLQIFLGLGAARLFGPHF
jgi:hypothetical protein